MIKQFNVFVHVCVRGSVKAIQVSFLNNLYNLRRFAMDRGLQIVNENELGG